MLQQVNIDLDCTPCTANKESNKPTQTTLRSKPKVAPPKPQKKLQLPKGGDAEGDVKLGFIEENSVNTSDTNNNTVFAGQEPTYAPKYIVVSTNNRQNPQEIQKQQLEDELSRNKTNAENLKQLILEDEKIKCKNCGNSNSNKLLNNNKVN
jgi:hypothetical protein